MLILDLYMPKQYFDFSDSDIEEYTRKYGEKFINLKNSCKENEQLIKIVEGHRIFGTMEESAVCMPKKKAQKLIEKGIRRF